MTAHFTDDLSGVFDGVLADSSGGSPPQIRFVSSSGQIVDGLFDILNPVSGDRLDGVYEATVTLGSFAEAGSWHVEYLLLNDEAGNSVSLQPDTSSLLFSGSFVLGSAAGDSLTGTAGADTIYGYGGNDTLFAGDGDDFVFAGDDNDLVIAGSGLGNDHYDGGGGIDTLKYTSTHVRIVVNLLKGQASGPEIGTDTISGFEKVTGGAGKDVLVGDGQNNGLVGGAGADALTGGGGADTLYGGLGRDMLTGGTEKDIFDFNAIKESVKGGSRDQITDFHHSQHDRIDLAGIDAKTHTGGNQAFHFVGTHAFTHHDGELRYSSHILQGDINGDGKADFEIHVNASSLHSGDFIL